METMQPIVSMQDQKSGNISRRKSIVLALVAALLFLSGGAYYMHSAGDAGVSALAPGSVAVTKEGFTPTTIRVKKGQQVTWKNVDIQPHQVVSENVAALRMEQSTILSQDDTATVTFEQAGTYQYHDNLSTPGFQGTVIVE